METIDAKNGRNFRNQKGWIGHSEEDRRYHLSIVAYINELNTTWKVTIIIIINKNKNSIF